MTPNRLEMTTLSKKGGDSEDDYSAFDPSGEVEVRNREEKRRGRISFETLYIPIGEELTLTRDSEKTAKVVKDDEVEYEGEPSSLSEAARKAMGYLYKISGMEYWEYKGEILSARRRRLKAECQESESDNEDSE